jgi:hypothetical protein
MTTTNDNLWCPNNRVGDECTGSLRDNLYCHDESHKRLSNRIPSVCLVTFIAPYDKTLYSGLCAKHFYMRVYKTMRKGDLRLLLHAGSLVQILYADENEDDEYLGFRIYQILNNKSIADYISAQ